MTKMMTNAEAVAWIESLADPPGTTEAAERIRARVTRARAVEMLREAQGGYTEARHARRADALAAILTEHPDARVESCADEHTGKRYGQAACRRGRCQKIGHTTHDRQYWAVWA